MSSGVFEFELIRIRGSNKLWRTLNIPFRVYVQSRSIFMNTPNFPTQPPIFQQVVGVNVGNTMHSQCIL